MAVLTDTHLASLRTAEDAARLTARLLPDLDAQPRGFFFRTAEQHLLTFMLIGAALREEKQAAQVQAFLALEYRPMMISSRLTKHRSCRSTWRGPERVSYHFR